MKIIVVDNLAFNCKWFKYIAYECGYPTLCLKNTEKGRVSASNSHGQSIRLTDTKIQLTKEQFQQICERLNSLEE